MVSKLKISIITPSFNQGVYLEQNIISVMNQNYSNFEHIIIDGGSSDCTLDVLKKYPHLIWVSEKDRGQADALNKGIQLATGEIIGWINSDDYYLPNVFNEVNKIILAGYDWVVGDLFRLMPNGDLINAPRDEIDYNRISTLRSSVRQPSTFYTKKIIDQVGGWDHNLYMVMDLDLWLRISKVNAPAKLTLPTAVFRIHAGQKSTAKNILRQTREILGLSKKYKLPLLAISTLAINMQSLVKKYIKSMVDNLSIRTK